jgi:hypothetical protein
MDLTVVNGVAIDDDVLSKIGVSSKAVIMRDGWLINGPVVEWWVVNWILGIEHNEFFIFAIIT